MRSAASRRAALLSVTLRYATLRCAAANEFEYTDSNGQKQKISKEEMEKRVEEQQKFKYVDGIMMKEDAGEVMSCNGEVWLWL